MPQFFKNKLKPGNPISTPGFSEGIMKLANAFEHMDCLGGYIDWSFGRPTIIPNGSGIDLGHYWYSTIIGTHPEKFATSDTTDALVDDGAVFAAGGISAGAGMRAYIGDAVPAGHFLDTARNAYFADGANAGHFTGPSNHDLTIINGTNLLDATDGVYTAKLCTGAEAGEFQFDTYKAELGIDGLAAHFQSGTGPAAYVVEIAVGGLWALSATDGTRQAQLVTASYGGDFTGGLNSDDYWAAGTIGIDFDSTWKRGILIANPTAAINTIIEAFLTAWTPSPYPSWFDHGELAGLEDDDHSQYWLIGAAYTRNTAESGVFTDHLRTPLVKSSAGAERIDVDSSDLLNATGDPTLDWAQNFLYDSTVSNLKSADWTLRLLYDTLGILPSANWGTRKLYDATGAASGEALDWASRYLLDALENVAVNWANRIAYDASGSNYKSVDWANRTLFAAGDYKTLDWEFQILWASSLGVQTASVNWRDRLLADAAGNTILDWSTALTADFGASDIITTGNVSTGGGITRNVDDLAASQTLDGDDHIVNADSSGGAVTITLPAAPASGQEYRISAVDGPITVARNGKTIKGLAEDATIASGNTLILIYSTTSGWF